jgi:hypothetical protein
MWRRSVFKNRDRFEFVVILFAVGLILMVVVTPIAIVEGELMWYPAIGAATVLSLVFLAVFDLASGWWSRWSQRGLGQEDDDD